MLVVARLLRRDAVPVMRLSVHAAFAAAVGLLTKALSAVGVVLIHIRLVVRRIIVRMPVRVSAASRMLALLVMLLVHMLAGLGLVLAGTT